MSKEFYREGMSSKCLYKQINKDSNFLIHDCKSELKKECKLDINNSLDASLLATNILCSSKQSRIVSTPTNQGLSSEYYKWISLAIPLLTASLLHHKDLPAPNNTISAAIKYIINNSMKTLEETFSDSKNELVKEQYSIFNRIIGSSEAGKASVLQTLAFESQFLK